MFFNSLEENKGNDQFDACKFALFKVNDLVYLHVVELYLLMMPTYGLSLYSFCFGILAQPSYHCSSPTLRNSVWMCSRQVLQFLHIGSIDLCIVIVIDRKAISDLQLNLLLHWSVAANTGTIPWLVQRLSTCRTQYYS